MRNIEYEIKVNEEGKPYIHLDNLNMDVDDMFFCFEITKYRLHGILADENNTFLPQEALEELALAGQIVGEISERIGKMVVDSNNLLDGVDDILNTDEENDD
jgi:hypothetical protein